MACWQLKNFAADFATSARFCLRALRQGGIAAATPVGLTGHVITKFTVDGVNYAADADLGVRPFRLPDDAEQVRKNVAEAYEKKRAAFGDKTIDLIIDAYATFDDNEAYDFNLMNEISKRQSAVLAQAAK